MRSAFFASRVRYRLIDLNLAVALYIDEGLHNATGPADFNAVCDRTVAEPEVYPRVA